MTAMMERELLDPLDEADAAVEEAQAGVLALEARVVDGDGAVTPEDVERARGLVRHAELRREGVRKRAAETALQLQAVEVAQLREDLAAFRAPAVQTPLHAAYAEAVRALAELRRQADAAAKARAQLESRAAELGVPTGLLPKVSVSLAVETFALVEARTGRPPVVDGRALPHPLLHSPDRAAELVEDDERRRLNVERVQAERVAEVERQRDEKRARASELRRTPGLT